VARIERGEEASLADLGLRLAETKQLTAALQAEIVPAQVAVAGECRRCCSSCGHKLAGKGHYLRRLFANELEQLEPDSGFERMTLEAGYQ
jgi:hypothetical protein